MTHPIICKTSRRPTVKGFGARSYRLRKFRLRRAVRRQPWQTEKQAGAASLGTRQALPAAVGRSGRNNAAGQSSKKGKLPVRLHTGRHTRRIFAAFNIYNYKNDIPKRGR